MRKTDIVKRVLELIESHETDKAAAFFAEEFTYVGALPKSLDRREFLEVFRSLVHALPDWRFNASNFREQADSVRLQFRITGTHRRELAVRPLRIEAVPATGSSVALPEEFVDIQFSGGRICAWIDAAVDGGGIPGIFDQIGADLSETPAVR